MNVSLSAANNVPQVSVSSGFANSVAVLDDELGAGVTLDHSHLAFSDTSSARCVFSAFRRALKAV